MDLLSIAAVTLAAQNAPPPVAVPPAPPSPTRPKLIERPQVRPVRAGEARENYGRDPEEAKRAEAEALAAIQAAEAEEAAARAAAAAAESPAPAPAAAPTSAKDPVPVAPSAIAAGAPAPGAPAARAARPPRAFPNLTPIAALAMLFAPAVGVIWMMSRRGPGPSE